MFESCRVNNGGTIRKLATDAVLKTVRARPVGVRPSFPPRDRTMDSIYTGCVSVLLAWLQGGSVERGNVPREG